MTHPPGVPPGQDPDRWDPDLWDGSSARDPRDDPSTMVQRGRIVLLGMVLLSLGGFVALFGYVYGPVAAGADAHGSVSVDQAHAQIAAVGGVVAALLGLAAAYLFRGSVPMTILGVIVAVTGVWNVVQLLPYL